MWVGAAIGGLVLATGIGLALGRLSPPGHHAIVWDIGRMAAGHSKVSGRLAGFAAAAAVFLANQVREGLDSARIASVITLFCPGIRGAAAGVLAE